MKRVSYIVEFISCFISDCAVITGVKITTVFVLRINLTLLIPLVVLRKLAKSLL